jgi:hypothetical protein
MNKVNSIRSVEMGETASAVRSLSRRAIPSGIRGADWRNPPPPSDTPQMVGDGTDGRPSKEIREIGLGATEFMPVEGRINHTLSAAARPMTKCAQMVEKGLVIMDCGGKRSATPLLNRRQGLHLSKSGVAAALCHRSPNRLRHLSPTLSMASASAEKTNP